MIARASRESFFLIPPIRLLVSRTLSAPKGKKPGKRERYMGTAGGRGERRETAERGGGWFRRERRVGIARADSNILEPPREGLLQ